jgi:GNAT superfamily N-acetyltransferase
MPELAIRRARAGEGDVLTALARRAKAHWGYSPELLARFADDLVLSEAAIDRDEVWVLDGPTGPIGFHRVVTAEPAVLEDLWVEPSEIGSGHGRRLWLHAVGVARSAGAAAIELDADPNAVGFYERMGARQVGDTPSAVVPGRTLPRMRADVR